MKIVNNRIYIVRGETPTYDSAIIDVKTGAPYIIVEKILNPTIEFVVRPSVYSRDDDYVFRAFIMLNNVHKFPTDEIVPYTGGDVWDDNIGPAAEHVKNLHRKTVTTAKGVSHDYAYYENGKWVPYELRLTFMFPYHTTSKMEPKTYQYEITLLGGNLIGDYSGQDISNDLDIERGSAYDNVPINVVYKKPLLDACDFVVGGSMSE